MRSNSRVLWVTRVRSLARAIAAISRSLGPMGVPAKSNWAWTCPAINAALSSNERLMNWLKKRFKLAMLRSRLVLLYAPYYSSDFTTEQSRISSGVSSASLRAMLEALLLSRRMQTLLSNRYIIIHSRQRSVPRGLRREVALDAPTVRPPNCQ